MRDLFHGVLCRVFGHRFRQGTVSTFARGASEPKKVASFQLCLRCGECQ